MTAQLSFASRAQMVDRPIWSGPFAIRTFFSQSADRLSYDLIAHLIATESVDHQHITPAALSLHTGRLTSCSMRTNARALERSLSVEMPQASPAARQVMRALFVRST